MKPPILLRAVLLASLPFLALGCIGENDACDDHVSVPFVLTAGQDFNSSSFVRTSSTASGGRRSFRWRSQEISGVCTEEHVSATFVVKVNDLTTSPGPVELQGEINHLLTQPYLATMTFKEGPREWSGSTSGGLADINWAELGISPSYDVALEIIIPSDGSEAVDWLRLKAYLKEINVSTTYYPKKTTDEGSALIGR